MLKIIKSWEYVTIISTTIDGGTKTRVERWYSHEEWSALKEIIDA